MIFIFLALFKLADPNIAFLSLMLLLMIIFVVWIIEGKSPGLVVLTYPLNIFVSTSLVLMFFFSDLFF